jgi:hypothetical protein
MPDPHETPARPHQRVDQPLMQNGSPWRGEDRRKHATPRLSRYTFVGGRRRGARRRGEDVGTFVDQYNTGVWAVMMWIALMNAGDSFFTLYHLQSGGIELNPVAAMMLATGRTGFVCLKSLLISVPLIVLCLHKNFPLARVGIWTAAAAYTSLLAYHLTLL